jgi:spore coat polysaccharide biosynthesis protein SpsF
MRIAGLIQARMGSSRLPGKVMRPIGGKPVVGHIIDRIERVSGLCGVVLATTVDPRNDPLVDYVKSRAVLVYREPDEDDIAARLLGAARVVQADAILKLNGDCPLADPGILQDMVDTFRVDPSVDYVSNKIVWTYPEGLSAEVIATRALAWCASALTDPEDRELVANYIRDHTARFTVRSMIGDRDLSRHRWVIDTQEDFAFVSRIFEVLAPQGSVFGLDSILRAVERVPDLQHEPAHRTTVS